MSNSEIKDKCPLCGGPLFVGHGGFITCSYVKCPNPCFISDLCDGKMDGANLSRLLLVAGKIAEREDQP